MFNLPSLSPQRFFWLNHWLILLFFVVLTYTTSATALDLERIPYLQQPTSSSIIIRWRTDSEVQGVVRYGDTATNLSQTVTSPTSTTEHSVQINGLSANTRYYYSVGTDSQTLAGADTDHFFTTAPATNTSLTTKLWILGDSGTNNNNARDVRDAYLTYLSNNSKADMLLMLGDNAYDDGTDAEYQRAMFDMYPTVLRNTPVWATIGNHDGRSADSATESGAYYDIFAFPRAAEVGGIASGTEAYYSFDYNNIHFISLDSHETDRSTNGAMATWLTQDLADTTQQWIIAFWHHPPYSKGSHDSDSSDEEQTTEMRNNFLPILEEAGVDLVLSGHSHSYERSKFIDGHYGKSGSLLDTMILNGGDGNSAGDGAYTKQANKAPHEGTVYVVAGSSGQLGPGTLDHPVMYKSLRNLGSMIIDIKDNRLDALFLRENGSTPDTFSIVKNGTPPPDNPTTTIAFQNDNLPNTNYNGTSDAYIAQADVNNNHGNATDLLLDGDDGSGNDLSSLIRWEIANFVPTGATIESASVTFDIFNSSGSSYEIYALKRAWNEAQVTWNQADDSNNWQSAGAEGSNDRDTQVLGTVNANNTGSLTINFNTAGLAVVQRWLDDPSNNYGIIIANSSSGDGVDFYSSEFSTQTSRPKLSLSYQSDNDNNDTEAPTTPSNLNASDITNNSVLLNWDTSTDNVAIKNYRIYRDDVQIDTTTNTSYTNSNLAAETTYRYEVSAVDTSDNESTRSTLVEVTTSITQDTEAPTTPSNLNASDITSNSVVLSWNASTDNVAIKNYRIYRDDVQIDTTTNTSYTNSNLAAETTYRYEVSAVDTSDNESTRSTLIEVTTGTTSTQGTAEFQNGNLPDSTYSGTNDAYIAQADSNNNQGNAADLLLDGDGNGISSLIRWEIANALPAGATIDSASMTVQVFNTSGQSYEIYALKRSWTDTQTTWNQADNSNNWQSVGAEGNNDRGIQVLGDVDANGSGSLTFTFNAAGVAAIQQWVDNPNSNYGIIIANSSHGDGVGFYSSEFSTATSRPKLSLRYSSTTNPPPATDNEPPTVPANLRETGVTANSASLSWDAATDNVAIQHYRLYRDGTHVDTVTSTSYTDNNLTANTTYTYTVDAVDTSNNASAQSSPITVSTTTPPTQDTGTAEFQNGNLPDSTYSGTNDAYIAQADANNNQGNASDLLLDGDGNGISSLIRWEIANALPAGAIIDSASITVQVFNTSGASYEIYALKRAWTDTQTTWNQADNSNNWQSVGAEGNNDRGTQVLGSIDANNSGSLTLAFNAAGVAAIQQWVDNPNSNYGIIIANLSHGDGVGFYSSEFGTLSSRPMLSLDYHTN